MEVVPISLVGQFMLTKTVLLTDCGLLEGGFLLLVYF